MSDRSFELWRKGLLGVCAFMVLFGLGLVFFDSRIIPGFNEQVSEVLWGQPDMPVQVVTYHRFLSAILGATVAGWALTMMFIVQHPFRSREQWAWWAMLSGPMLWFVFDCSSSLFFGVWPNALLNLFSYLPLLIPVLCTRKAFWPTGHDQTLRAGGTGRGSN